MTGEVQDERTDAPPVDPDSAVKLRGDPPRVIADRAFAQVQLAGNAALRLAFRGQRLDRHA